MSNIPTCAVRAVVRDSVGGQPVEGAKVSARLSSYEVYQGYVVPHLVQGVTDVNGECILNLWPNQLGAVESNYAVTILALGKSLKTFCVVPSAPAAELSDIAELPPYDGLNDGSLIIGQVLAALTAAQAARDVAITKAGEAGISATNAANSETNAAASMANAATSETSALASRNRAQAWAIQLGMPVEGGEYSAKYHALKAAESAASIADGPVYSWIGLFGIITQAQARTALNIGNVQNTADIDKVVSTPTRDALNLKLDITAATDLLAKKADLVGGLIPASQLPSSVDNMDEFPTRADFPAVGVKERIYLAVNDATPANPTRQYRWAGTTYAEINPSPGTTDALIEGSGNLYFTAARVRDTVLAGLSLVANAAITASDTVVSALGKLQKQVTDLIAAVGLKADAATTVTKDMATGAANIPVGTTAQRPVNGAGKLRFNSSLGRWEGNTGAAWGSLGGASGGGTDAIFYVSDAVMTADHTVAAGTNEGVFGPLTIAPGAVLEISAGSTLTIV
ncbi:hypothetical protein [Variovorax sp. PAMC26660]|uniref:hypothetical protein n=1 Tax=Variovorax sp. PAMC26660 TaxID=2762322 RepID=UPI00164CF39F|nr:hypothetical protein [Variovorax sp. PAMC26660]QNK66087.1 hypothetical protein H7F35_23185 [Variovorax sp. PAMC26660]